jgi:PKD domain
MSGRVLRGLVAILGSLVCLALGLPLGVGTAAAADRVVTTGVVSQVHLMLACTPDPACQGGDHTGDDVHGDQGEGAIVGTGGLILPGSSYDGDEDARRTAATCKDCRWRLQPRCLYNTNADDDAMCAAAAATCPAGELRYRVFLYTPDDPEYREVGSVCIGAQGVTTTDELGARVRDAFIDLLPKPDPAYQPKGGDIVNLPAVFASGQPHAFGPRTFALLGEQVEVTAVATWSWDFGDGARLVTVSPGGGWPDASVSHVYRTAGTRTVNLTTSWTGDFTVEGLGPFPVGGDAITQAATLTVPVRPAHTVLVSGQ